MKKWKWCFITQDTGIWRENLISKYGNWRHINRSCRSREESTWWLDLKKMCGCEEEQNWFNGNISLKLGNGEKIRFWTIKWSNGRRIPKDVQEFH